jgi:hypothetical protein
MTRACPGCTTSKTGELAVEDAQPQKQVEACPGWHNLKNRWRRVQDGTTSKTGELAVGTNHWQHGHMQKKW